MASSRGPDNSVRVAADGNQLSISVANVFRAQLTTGSSIVQSDLDAWLALFGAQYKTSFQARMGAQVQMTQFKAVFYAPGGGELVSTYVPAAWNGTESGTGIPGDVCKTISWSSGVYWRGGKPRTYIPGVVPNDIQSPTNQLTATERANLLTAALGFRTGVNAFTSGTITGTTLGFVSFRSHNAPRVAPLFFPFTGAVVHPRLTSQRRRLGKWVN